MFELRRWAAAGVATLLAGVLAPAGNGTAEAQTPPGPSDEVEVTYLTHPNGEPLFVGGAINNRGEVLTYGSEPESAVLFLVPTDPVIWKDGEVTPVPGEDHDEEARWSLPSTLTGGLGNDFSERGEVIGWVQGPDQSGIEPDGWSWLNGATTILPLGDAVGAMPQAVNDHGKIAGLLVFEDDGLPSASLAVWHDGDIITAPPSVDGFGPIVGINNRSQVAFNAPSEGTTLVTVWNVGGDVVDLGTLGGDTTEAAAINHRGMVVGTSATADGEEHAFLWHEGEMVDLGTLGGDTSEAVALNEWGQVIGTSTDADGEEHGFLWHEGEMTRIDGLDEPSEGETSEPLAINNWGQVVGRSSGQAFLWQNGQNVNLGDIANPDEPSRALDINDRGQIVGSTGSISFGWGAPFTMHTVVWTVSPLWGYPDGL